MRRKWFIVFTLIVVWTREIAQLPISDKETIHEAQREASFRVDGKECCPCPSSATGKDLEGQADSRSASVLPVEGLKSDCPCLRDSEAAASSLFDFPSHARSIAAFVRPNDNREEGKPLLHPEVGLANSVLETLREATEEEYHDAVARDAARATADPGMFERHPEPAKNIVTIIVNSSLPPMPAENNELMMSETHTQESRCIHSPLGRSVFESSSLPRSNYVTEIRHIPNLGRLNNNGRSSLLHFDNGLSASSVHESVVKSPKESEFKRTKHPFLNTLPRGMSLKQNKPSKEETSLKNAMRIPNINRQLVRGDQMNTETQCRTSMGAKERIHKFEELLNKSEIQDMDNQASEIVDMQVENDQTNKSNLKFRSNTPVLPKKETVVSELVRPLIPHNLFNLKDVELVPTTRNINENMNLKTPNFNIPSINDLIAKSKANAPELIKIPTLNDLFRNSIWVRQKNISDENIAEKMDSITNEPENNIQKIQTDILDAIPSPSQNSEISYAENAINEPTSRSAQNNENNSEDVNESEETDFSIQQQNISPETNKQVDNAESLESNSDNVETVQSEPDINHIDSISFEEENESENTSEQTPLQPLFLDELHKKSDPDKTLNIGDTNEIVTETKNQFSKGFKIEHTQINESEPEHKISTKKDDILESPSTSLESEEIIDEIDNLSKSQSKILQNTSDNTCLTESESPKSDAQSFLNSDLNDSNEMAVEPSNPIGSSLLPDKPMNLLGSIFRQSPIIQPLDTINLGNGLFTSPLINPANINTPSIDTLREELSNIFGNKDLSGRNVFSDFNTDDEIVDKSMETDSSSPKGKLTLPSQDPAKEINLNMIKINPLKLEAPFNLKSISSGLNFDSLKARVKVPSSTWKPLKLESTFGKGDGLLGASLSLEPLNRKGLSSLKLPDLEEMKANLKARAENLLNSRKLDLNTKTLINDESVKKLGDFRENIHSNAASAMSNLQQTLQSRLNQAKVQTDNLLGNSRFAQPENLLDIARFDVDDKLQELHSNIADHLSSVHEKLMSPQMLPSLNTPVLGYSFDSFGKPSPSMKRKQTSSRSKSSKTAEKPTFRVSKPRGASNNDRNPHSLKKKVVDKTREDPWKKQSKLSKSVTSKGLNTNSFVTPKPSKLPLKKSVANKSKLLSGTSARSQPMIQSLHVSPISPAPDIRRVISPYSFKGLLKSDNSKYRSALFTTTTTRPKYTAPPAPRVNTQNSDKLSYIIPKTPRTNFKSNKSPGLKLLEIPHGKLESLIQSLRDADGSPSEHVFTKILPDFSRQQSRSLISGTERPGLLSDVLKPIIKVNISKIDLPERTGTFKPIAQNLENSKFQESEKFQQNEIDNTGGEEIETITKTTPTSMVNKLRNSLRKSFKLNSFDKDIVGSVLESRNDMTEGASDNIQNTLMLDQHMKENVNYKCRMVCTRE